ncbi:MAG: lysylphosphatidylglycerol synthase transmembrane domain-containing protein [Ilumatobacteraceae bacterium]
MNVWSAAPDDWRARRPTDVALLVAGIVALGIVVQAQPGGGTTGIGIASIVGGWTFLRHVWWTLMLLASIAAGALLVLSLVDRRWTLSRDVVVAGAFGGVVTFVLYHLFVGPAGAAVTAVLPSGSSVLPLVRLTLVVTVFAVASPHVVRPLRYAGHVVVGILAVATLALGGTNLNGVLTALLVAWIAAAAVHLLFGSPGGLPSVERVQATLDQLEARITGIRPLPRRRDGVARFAGESATGPVSIEIFGRDAWNGQLGAAVSRWLTMRGPGAHLAVTRIQQAEHEALMALVAIRHGVEVPAPTVVGKAPNGDVVMVVSAAGVDRLERLTASSADAAWDLLARLHDGDLVHRAISPERLAVMADGTLMFTDLDRAVLASDRRSRQIDRAQLLVSLAVVGGTDTAIEGFLACHPHGAEQLVRYLQPPVLPPELRRRVKASGLDLAALRARLAERAGVEEPQLEKVQRISRAMVTTTILLGVAAMFLVSTFADLDWSEIRSSLEGANWWWLIFAFVMAQAVRLGGGLSMLGACRTPLPTGPVFLLQYSFPFIDVAAPAAAGRIAATMRFQQKYGVAPTAALSASIIDTGAGFAAEIIVMAITFSVTDLSLSQLGGDNFNLDMRLLLIILIVVAVIASVILLIPVVRKRISPHVKEIWSALAVLKSPAKSALLLGGSILTELLHAVAMGLCLRALGLSAPFAGLLVVTAFIRFVSGVSPIPGGLGIAEAGLTAGLVSIGVPVEFAFSAAMLYRLCTFYVPPAYGWAVLGILRRREYL